MQFSFTFPAGSGTAIQTASVSVPTSAWSNKTCTVAVTGVTTSSNVLMGCDSASWDAVKAAAIRAAALETGTVSLRCSSTPTEAVTLIFTIF